jgi:choline dehydrogenase-like flavoprotein
MSASTQFDAIVVGSGITGGWAAKELTERGLKVLMLERGKPLEHRSGYVTEHQPPWNIPLRENPYVQSPGKPYNWLRADVVGGRSLMWGRHSYRWSDLDFEANKRDGNGNDWPIRYRDIADWYSHVERFIGVSGQAEGLPHLPDGEFQPPMQLNVVEKAFKSRVEAKFPKRCVTIGRVANLTEPLGERAPCHYCGPCQRGCSAGAYFSTQSSTLPAAQKTGRLTLLPNSVVESLEYDPASRRVTAVRVIDTQTKAHRRYTAKLVFMCSSTFGTLQVLLNSKSASYPTGIADTSGTLGRYVMDHYHGHGAAGSIPGFDDKYYHGNRPNTFYLPRFRNLQGADPGIDFVRGYGYQGVAAPLEWSSTWNRIPGFGADYKRALRKPGGWRLFMLAFGECLPYADNRVVLDAKRDRFDIPQLRFEMTYRGNEQRMGADIVRESVAMLEAAGATDIMPYTSAYTPGTSIHEFGGARMGKDPRASVLNEHNQAHDIPNLFVTDGACMASASCVNPSLTFMALTARAAAYAVAELQASRI